MNLKETLRKILKLETLDERIDNFLTRNLRTDWRVIEGSRPSVKIINTTGVSMSGDYVLMISQEMKKAGLSWSLEIYEGKIAFIVSLK